MPGSRVWVDGQSETVCDSLGRFALAVEPGDVTVLALPTVEGAAALPPMTLQVEAPAEGHADLEFGFARIAARVRFLDAHVDSVLSLDLRSAPAGHLARVLAPVTDGEAVIALCPIAPGIYQISVNREPPALPYRLLFQELEVGPLADIEVAYDVVPMEGNVRGIVSWPGGPVAGVRVSTGWGGPTAETDAEGRFAFQLQPGSYRIDLDGPASEPFCPPVSRHISVPAEGTVDVGFGLARFRVEIFAPPELEGANVYVGYLNDFGGGFRYLSSPVSGGLATVEIGPLPAGRYHLRLRVSSGSAEHPWPHRRYDASESEDIYLRHTLLPGARLDVDFDPPWPGFLPEDVS